MTGLIHQQHKYMAPSFKGLAVQIQDISSLGIEGPVHERQHFQRKGYSVSSLKPFHNGMNTVRDWS